MDGLAYRGRGRLFEVGAYSRLGAYQIFPFALQQNSKCYLQKAKMQQSKVSVKYSEENSVFGRVSYYLLLEF